MVNPIKILLEPAPNEGNERLTVGLTTDPDVIVQAQRLRYQVFGEELGARLDCRTPGVDEDFFDPYCEHLVVRDKDNGEVVGTYRLLTPENARLIKRYYTDGEFDLSRLQHLRPRMVEIGRSCVHPDYRNGSTITLLWSGLTRFMRERGYEYLIGCASIPMNDGGHVAASIFNRLREKYLSPPEYRVFPLCPLPMHALRLDLPAEVPPLIKGYLRCGCWICGEPAWDPDFNTADLPILLPVSRLTPRYARYLERSGR